MIEIPEKYLSVRYNSQVNPDNPPLDFSDLSNGANCLIFSYAILKEHGYDPPILWSREAWADVDHSYVVEKPQEFDLLFYGNNTSDSYWWHLGLSIGDNIVIHLSKEKGIPEIVDYLELVNRGSYKFLQGIKRLK